MTPDVWTSSLIKELSDDDIKNFQDMVLRDVKNKFCILSGISFIPTKDLWFSSIFFHNSTSENPKKLFFSAISLNKGLTSKKQSLSLAFSPFFN